ncbi:hypothetical protein QQ045_033349 [Rhodiola kirilowii]
MSESTQSPDSVQPTSASRIVGGTEYSWCKAIPGGTGTTVLGLLVTKSPDISVLKINLHKLQNAHPILLSKLRYSAAANNFSFVTPSTSSLEIDTYGLDFTSRIFESSTAPSRFHAIVEHEMNKMTWRSASPEWGEEDDGDDVMFANCYDVEEGKWAVVLRLHTAACDRAAAAALLRELVEMLGEKEGEIGRRGEVGLTVEEYVPAAKAHKPFWARGIDMLGYSLNSFRLSNLDFHDANSPRSSQVIRLQLNAHDTDQILKACKSREIKLSGVLAAAGVIAARSSKELPDGQWEKYSVTTLIDCRPFLDPPLPDNHIGFYHSAIINTHDIKGGEDLWDLAKRTFSSFESAKTSNKHFTDMGDLNFLMLRALENPGLTPSGSLRTCLISVFEDTIVEQSNEMCQELGLEDMLGCASIHGIGPSIGIFHKVQDGELDCACVYPSPLFLREHMNKVVDDMKRVLVEGCMLE